MRSDVKTELDKLQNKQRKQILFGILLAIIFMLILGSIYFPVTTYTVLGKTTALTALQTDEGSKLRVRVKLDTGKTILAIFPEYLAYKKGKKGEILEGHTLIGKPTYRFVRYVQ